MRLILVRHGEPDYQRDCLTPLGRRQALAAAERLLNEGISAVYSSPLGRALETAQYTAGALGLPVETLPFMRELHWGGIDGAPLPFNGHPWDAADEMARTGWDMTRTDWAAHPLFARNLVTAEAAHVGEKTDEWLRSLGYAREGTAYRCLRESDGQRTAALFCHGGSSTAMLARVFSLPFPYLCAAVHLDFTGIFIIRFSRREGGVSLPVAELCGDDRHIRGLDAPEGAGCTDGASRDIMDC